MISNLKASQIVSNTIFKWQIASLLPIFLIFFQTLLGVPSVRQAEIYFEAGDYGHARNQYEGMQSSHLPKWQQAIIAYDIGTVLLYQDKATEALSYFQDAAGLEPRMLLLQSSLKRNMSIAYMQMAEKALGSIKMDPDVSIEDYGVAMEQARHSLKEIEEAQKAHCVLLKAEGSLTCEVDPDLAQMHGEAKMLMAELLESYWQFRTKHISLPQFISELSVAKSSSPDSRKVLEALLQSIYNEESLQVALKDLDGHYADVVLTDPLQTMALLALIKQQDAIRSTIEKSSIEKIGVDFHSAQHFLERSYQALEAAQFFEAKLLLEVGRHYIQQILERLDHPHDSDAERILKSAWQQESLALKLNRLISQSRKETVSEQTRSLVRQFQEQALHTSRDFNEAAIEEQKKEVGQVPHDWEGIFKSFREGEEAINKAQGLSKDRAMILFQERAVKSWQEALDKFKKRANSSQTSAEKTSSNKLLNEVLESIQEMENDDKSSPQLILAPGAKGEKRPW